MKCKYQAPGMTGQTLCMKTPMKKIAPKFCEYPACGAVLADTCTKLAGKKKAASDC